MIQRYADWEISDTQNYPYTIRPKAPELFLSAEHADTVHSYLKE